MRMVVDANFFRDPGLEEFLQADRSNIAVLPEYACMETFKGNALKNLKLSMGILARFPSQVIVLKPVRTIIQLQHQSGVLETSALVDEEQTRGFGIFCRLVERAAAGDLSLRKQIEAYGAEASKRFGAMGVELETVAEAVEALAASFSTEHVRAIRANSEPPKAAGGEVVQAVLMLAHGLFSTHPDVLTPPRDPRLARDAFLFRLALAHHLLLTRWIEMGGARTVKPGRHLSDAIDMNYVCHATYFDGLLTRDHNARRIYEQTKFCLEEVFVT